MDDIFSRLLVFQFVLDLIKVTVGAGLCFGALKWRRGLLTSTAIYWGIFLGLIVSMLFIDTIELGGIIAFVAIGAILIPILTYTIPGVNRFVLGFLVSSKLFFMLTTVLAKSGDMDIEEAIVLPLVAGTIVGLCLMAWTRVRVSAFVLGCTFIGASEIAPVISEWINRILYAATGDFQYLFDPIDILFALFKIELTDTWTLIAMVVLMIWGGYKQISNIKANGISLDTPLIGFEMPKGKNGRIYTKDGYIDTLD